MPCGKKFAIWEESDKVLNKWVDSKVLEKWGFTNDKSAFKKLFEASTGKVFMAGDHLNAKDYKKMNVAIDTLERDLQNPGALSNKFLRNFYVGQAKNMRNPVTKDFYETLVNANEFRNRRSAVMMSNYGDMLSDLKLAIMEFQGSPTDNVSKGSYQMKDMIRMNHAKGKMKANKLFNTLNNKEKALIKKKAQGESFQNEMAELFQFLENEGSVFQDFIDRVVAGNDIALRHKYRGEKVSPAYINRINNAASKWNGVQTEAQTSLIQSINNLSETIKLKYGKESKTATRLIDEYNKISTQLENSKEGYIPHYILDILGQSLEIRDRMNASKSNSERDNILNEYIGKTKEINTNLIQRLKARGTEVNEYFSRNPVLYASKYIEQVLQFNHSSFIDLAYTKGLQKLTNVAFKNDGKEGDAAKVYLDIFNDMRDKSLKRNRIDTDSTSDNLFRLITSMQFTSKLGFSTRGAVRNATQRLLNWQYFGRQALTDAKKAYNGNDDYKNAMDTELHKHGLKFLDISKVTEGAVTAADLVAHGIKYEDGNLSFKDKETVLEKLTKAGMKVSEASSVFTQLAENLNRQSTFRVAFNKRVEQLRRTDKYSGITDSKELEDMYAMAGNYAAKKTSLLHFEYSPTGKANILQSKPGAILGQFQHYAFSFANFQTQMVKDYARAFKAGDYTGEEGARIMRMAMLTGMTELASILTDINLTSYIQNDTFNRSLEFIKFLFGDEEEKREAFYGKGVAGAIGSVPISDLIELHNLGAAAGYWNLLADEESTAGWLMGRKEYDRIDDKEFAKEFAGMFSIEGERLLRRTGPALLEFNGVQAFRAEFGLYPGTTTIGFNTRKVKKKVLDTMSGKKPTGRTRDYNKSKYSRDSIMKSLDRF